MRFDVKPQAANRAGIGVLLLFTIFWCGITGVFVGFIAHSFWRAAYAQHHYLPAEGTVLSSKVNSYSGNKGTTYSFGIRYRYTVDGALFEGDRYTFGSGSSSDGRRRATELVHQHHAGSPIIVYYDPNRPEESVINRAVDPMVYFMLLFLQPFILVGCGLLGAIVSYPFRRAAIRKFTTRPADVPWKIPSWGTLERGFAGFELQPKMTLSGALVATLLGYGLVSFASIFVVGFLFGGFSGGTPHAIIGAFSASVLGGVAGGVFYSRSLRNRARLVIDPTGQLIKLSSPLRQVEMAFGEVAGWSLKQILNPRNAKQGGNQSAYASLLSIHTTKGEDVPVHVFGADADAPMIAQKVADTFGAWTNKPIFEEPPPSTSEVIQLLTVSGALAAAQEIKAAAAQLKDLF